jgi:hypothetical protein
MRALPAGCARGVRAATAPRSLAWADNVPAASSDTSIAATGRTQAFLDFEWCVRCVITLLGAEGCESTPGIEATAGPNGRGWQMSVKLHCHNELRSNIQLAPTRQILKNRKELPGL